MLTGACDPVGMRVFVFLAACLMLLAACDAPTRGFGGAEVSRHTVDGSSFTIHHDGGMAQAVRTNRQLLPIGTLAGQAAIAMQQATGCRVRDLAGDAAVLVARLNCGKAVAPTCEVDAILKGRRGMQIPVVRRCG